jgi:hypothetical protein
MRDRIHYDLPSQAVETYRTTRSRVGEYPGTIAAIVIGIGVTAALIWAARRAGGWRNLQDQAADKARQGYDYAVENYERARGAIKERAQRFQDSQQLTQ